MTKLAIDTTSRGCSAALRYSGDCDLGTGSKPVYKSIERYDDIERGHAEIIIGQLEDLSREAQTSFQNISSIIVSVGPGSFTGVRVGVALARGLSLANGAALQGCYSTTLIASVFNKQYLKNECNPSFGVECGTRFLVVIDAGRGQIYGQVFGRGEDLERITDPLLIEQEMLQVFALENDVAGLVGPAAEKFKGLFKEGAKPCTLFFVDAGTSANDLFEVDETLMIVGENVKPQYLRAPDAKPQSHKALARRET